MVHSGSRGMGQAIRDHHVRSCVVGRSGLAYLDAREPAGRAYLGDMGWALAYAEENRRRIIAAVVEVVADVVGARESKSKRPTHAPNPQTALLSW